MKIWATGFLVVLAAIASAQTTTRVSVSSTGEEANGHSRYASISADGRFVAFYNDAANLVPGDTNGAQDIFVHDRQTGTTERVSVSSAGVQGNSSSTYPSISGDSRFVAFESYASNLIVGDSNGSLDIFVYDRQTSAIERVSVTSTGTQVPTHCFDASISSDGNFVAFESSASNIVPGDTNGSQDIFVRDRQMGMTERASVNSSGIEGNSHSHDPSFSSNGRFVAFSSASSNLVPGDTNGQIDIFVRDLQNGITEIVSVSSSGAIGNNLSFQASLSSDGRFVSFASDATNLVDADTNGVLDIFVHDRQTVITERVSVNSLEVQGNNSSYDHSSVSADGRFVAFQSNATNLGGSGPTHIYVRDRQLGITEHMSVSTFGIPADGLSFYPSISADARFVVFESFATNLVVGDGNSSLDVFVRDRWMTCYEDADQDGFGNSAVSYSSPFPPCLTGYVADDSDCDDTNVTIYPGAPEMCDGLDNDCDTEVDEGLIFSYFLDADGDGYGDPLQELVTCAPPPGYVQDNTDCDDTNPSIYPSAPEICDDLDNDCDMEVDEGLIFSYFLDADGDGYGDPLQLLVTCAPPSGYVLNNLDCDDTNASVYPGAPEVCDGLDNDCDGEIDDGLYSVSSYCTAGTTVHGCVPAITSVGVPSANASSGFDIVVTSVEGMRSGAIFYGFYPFIQPWAPGSPSYICIASPVKRTGVHNSGGTAGYCNGELRTDFNAWITAHPGALGSPFVPGQVFRVQAWFRDPAAPKGSNLSDALTFALCF